MNAAGPSPSVPGPATRESDAGVAASPARTTARVFAMVGNPNCGKTTIFNALTGLRQKVGNYPGVTVERKEGVCFGQHGENFRVIDLPGAYSLNARSPDEAVLRDVLLGRRSDTPKPDCVVCVIDASNPERNLYLATQILELGIPTIIALNMIDVAQGRDVRLDSGILEKKLGVPVVPMQANIRKGLVELKFAMSRDDIPVATYRTPIPHDLETALLENVPSLGEGLAETRRSHGWAAFYLLGEHDPGHHGLSESDRLRFREARRKLEAASPGWEENLVAVRYDAIHEICKEAVTHPHGDAATLTDRLDSFLLHRFWGWATLLGIMTLLFSLIFSFADVPMTWIETLFERLSGFVKSIMPPGDLRNLVTDGVIAGVGGVVIFLPQILMLFFFIGLMEDTGYMARVAFIMDRLMSKVGLNGKSFIPLLSSYACAVPGIMAARTIESPKDRLITIMVAPLTSCSARIPVYVLMIATLVPSGKVPLLTKVGFMLGLYALGTLGVFAFAWIFNRFLMRGESSPMILELPSYKAPTFKAILLHMWERTRIFVRRAGTIILGISILLWFLANYPKVDTGDKTVQLSQSFAGQLGHIIEPAIKPLGYDWKIGVGLIASFAAREIFVSSMSVIYHVEDADDEEIALLRARFLESRHPDGRPVFTPLVCLSLLVFYVFAMQCMSTIAVVKRETNSWRWPIFQFGYMTATAYLAALAVYQVGSMLGY